MHAAIDMDGTLAAHPSQFLDLMRALKAAGHYVTILPGATAPNNEPFRLEQLKSLGIPPDAWNELHVCYGADGNLVGQAKGEYCRDHRVDVIFDDLPHYLKWVRQLSPATMCCMMFT